MRPHIVVLLAIATMASSHCVHAQMSVLNSRRPAKGVAKSCGLWVNVQDEGLGTGQFGYRRILCNVNSPTGLPGDTQVTVRVNVGNWYSYRNRTEVEVDGVLPAGATSTQLVVRLPQSEEWSIVWWDVWVDGVHQPALGCKKEQPEYLNGRGNSRFDNDYMLQLDADPVLSGLINQLSWFNRPSLAGVDLKSVQANLSDNWLDYTPYDLVKLDIGRIEELAEQDPEQFEALLKWVHAGGTLWINGVGDDWNRLNDIAEQFGWQKEPSIEPVELAVNASASETQWSYIALRQMLSEEELDGLQMEMDFDQTRRTEPNSATKPSEPVATSKGWFVVRQYGWGRVAAFKISIRTQPGNLSRYSRTAASGYWLQQSWPHRHGLLPGYTNRDFSNWLIPGVGLAPVVSFQVLITLFVLAIGPANYWLLKRAGRLHLMVVTVPAAALLITGALLAYGLLSDGLATYVRAQSITLVDQPQDRATSWSRLSYYAAFAPSDGLIFSDRAAVYSIEPDSGDGSSRSASHGEQEIVWADTQQQLTRGWLRSRTPTQFLVVEPRPVTAELQVQLNDTPTATSTFDSDIQLMVVVGDDGQWYLAEQVAQNEPARLQATDRSDALAKVRDLLNGREPQFPAGFDSMQNYSYNRRIYGSYRGDYRDIDASASNSLLQETWPELLGMTESTAMVYQPGTYLLIGDKALVPFAENNRAVEDSSVHIVIGRW